MYSKLTLEAQLLRRLVGRKGDSKGWPDDLAIFDDALHSAADHVSRDGEANATVCMQEQQVAECQPLQDSVICW